MAIRITTLGVEIPGQVTRKHDAEADTTTIIVNEAQARSAYESLGSVLAFFDTQRATTPALDEDAAVPLPADER